MKTFQNKNDINKYNQCVAKQMQMDSNQNRLEVEYLRNEIIKLKEENFVLRQKLDHIKNMLKNIQSQKTHQKLILNLDYGISYYPIVYT